MVPDEARAARVHLRAAGAGDLHFLMQVYGAGRQEEMAAWGLTEEQRLAFVKMQFQARRAGYQAAYPTAGESIILEGAVPVGSTIVFRGQTEIRLVDLSLLPQHRNRGIGSQLIAGLIAEAAQSGVRLRLMVVSDNPAMRLYRRLGFVPIGERYPYVEMEYNGACA